MLKHEHNQRIKRARASFVGLSVGDALGESYFGRWQTVTQGFDPSSIAAPWKITDDSVMALSILDVLFEHGEIQEAKLARAFATRYRQDPRRGYGGGAHDILLAISEGRSWETVSKEAFGGGSMGNGGAMRVAPLGAYFAFDADELIVEQARKSACVTHAHAEGQAGAIAVALAAAWTTRHAEEIGSAASLAEWSDKLFSFVLNHTPHGETWDGIKRARRLKTESPVFAASELGCGRKVTAPDTVPFCLWCAGKHLGDYGPAIRAAISAGGDIDTNCAIIGGILVMASGHDSIPTTWRESRELTDWETQAAWNQPQFKKRP